MDSELHQRHEALAPTPSLVPPDRCLNPSTLTHHCHRLYAEIGAVWRMLGVGTGAVLGSKVREWEAPFHSARGEC